MNTPDALYFSALFGGLVVVLVALVVNIMALVYPVLLTPGHALSLAAAACLVLAIIIERVWDVSP